MYVCTFVCLAQKLPLLWLLIITIKHNDYIFSSSRYAYGKLECERERQSECKCVNEGVREHQL